MFQKFPLPRALPTELSIFETRDRKIEREHNTRLHLHERADAARRLMTHVRDHAASAAGRETVPKIAKSIVG